MNKQLLLSFILITHSFTIFAGFKNMNRSQMRDALKDIHIDSYVFLRTLQSPLYSLPLERSLTPICGYAIGDRLIGHMAIAPFVQMGHTDFSKDKLAFHTEDNGGFLVKSRFSWNHLWIESGFTLESSKTKIKTQTTEGSLKYAGFDNFAVTLGAEYWLTQKFYANLKFLAFASHCNHDFFIEPIGTMSFASLGLESDMVYTVHQSDQTLCNLVTNIRWLHFGEEKIKNTIYDEEKRRKIVFNEGTVKPGNFFDLLVGADLAWGCNLRHRLQVGYDATFNTHAGFDQTGLPIKYHFINNPSHTLHTVYGFYAYEMLVDRYFCSIGLGSSATIVPNQNTRGLMWLFGTIHF